MKKTKGATVEPQQKRPRVYWDACIFIHWLKATGELGVDEQFRRLDAKELTAVTSVLTVVEVLECDIPPERKHLLPILKQNPDKLTIVQVGWKEAENAHEIRSHYKETTEAKVKTPDAIHLATAVLTECDVFYTLDEKLTKLPEAGVLYGLKIEVPPHPPEPAQKAMLEVPPKDAVNER